MQHIESVRKAGTKKKWHPIIATCYLNQLETCSCRLSIDPCPAITKILPSTHSPCSTSIRSTRRVAKATARTYVAWAYDWSFGRSTCLEKEWGEIRGARSVNFLTLPIANWVSSGQQLAWPGKVEVYCCWVECIYRV